ncbi:MAG: hypothetical protein LBK12_08985, partial [Odoribacteraceae bacterium]|nr:hypothetical protein [Odoribacteraceae bacterium]
SGTLEYEAAGGGALSFPVTSAATWKLAETPDQPYLALLGNESDFHAAATNETYNFSLEANPLYVPRVATIGVTSSDDNFAGREFYIKQKSADPFIIITDPTNGDDPPTHAHEFTSSATKTVTFTTNAKWKFTIDDATYANVITGASETKDATHDLGATPTGPENGSVTFTPAAGAGTLPAGTTWTTVTFSTVNPDGAPEDTKEITFSRVVPVNWIFKGYSLDGLSTPTLPTTGTYVTVPKSGGDVWLHAETNTGWYGKMGSTVVNTPAVSGYEANSTRKMVVPALVAATAASWTGNTDSRIWYGYKLDGSEAPDPEASHYFHARQAPYTLDVTNVPSGMVDPISGNGTVTVTVTTDAPSFSLVLKVNGTNDQVGSLSGSGNGSKTVTVNRITDATYSRIVNIINSYDGSVRASFTQYREPEYVLSSNIANRPSSATCPSGYTVLYSSSDQSGSNINGLTVYDWSRQLIPNQTGIYIGIYYLSPSAPRMATCNITNGVISVTKTNTWDQQYWVCKRN